MKSQKILNLVLNALLLKFSIQHYNMIYALVTRNFQEIHKRQREQTLAVYLNNAVVWTE